MRLSVIAFLPLVLSANAALAQAPRDLCQEAVPNGIEVFLGDRPADFDQGLEEGWLPFSDGPEHVAIGDLGGAVALRFGGGDDRIWIVRPGYDVTVSPGLGSDLIVLCDIEELSYSFDVGEEMISEPGDADTVVLRAPIFRNAPAGFHRELMVLGVDPANDRIIVEVPTGWEGQEFFRPGIAGFQLGDVFVSVRMDNRLSGEQDYRALFEFRTEADLEETAGASSVVEVAGGDTQGSAEAVIEGDAGASDTALNATSASGGVFCGAQIYSGSDEGYGQRLCMSNDSEGCVSPDDSGLGTLILGADQGGRRFFGYDAWFANGHNCSLRAEFTRTDAAQWRYEDATCSLTLAFSDAGPQIISTGAAPCASLCGARASLAGVTALWSDNRAASPTLDMLDQMDSVCSDPALMMQGTSALTANMRGTLDTAFGADVFTLDPQIGQPFRAQRILNALGFSTGGIDGTFGPNSRRAALAFSETHGLDVGDGSLTPELINVLESVLALRPTAPRPDDARAMVESLYVPQVRPGIFAFTQRVDWFTPDTLDLIAFGEIAYSRRFGVDGFDFNPLLPGNAMSAENLQVSSARAMGEDMVQIDVQFSSFGQPVGLMFTLHRINDVWRIHDISMGAESLRAQLARF